MSEEYTRDHLKLALAKILLTLGCNTVNSAPLEILTEILQSYLQQLTRTTVNYANEYGCTQPNLDHLALTFRDMNINLPRLGEYVKYVNFGPPPAPVPKYPVPKEDHLNFLKPGSKEVVTRPVYIHEHLPPMNPLFEGNENDADNVTSATEETSDNNIENGQIFKKPADILPDKRNSFRREEESSRPTREISSVMMTTSGFLSPAREGKLPESRTPIQPEPINPPATVNETIDLSKKPTKVVKKSEPKKVKQSNVTPEPSDDKRHKVPPMKCVVKSKQAKTQKHTNSANSQQNNDIKVPVTTPKLPNHNVKVNKALQEARLKTQKLNTTITPIPLKPLINAATTSQESDNVDKLFTEPDKKKVNIFKKISNVKNEKTDNKFRKDGSKQGSRESSPNLIIDESDDVVSKLSMLSSDVTIEPINPPVVPPTSNFDKVDAPYYDDDSQPGTPSTPKTPEMVSHSPPLVKEKRKRKDGSRKVKKIPKIGIDNDAIDIVMDRPKTPEAQGLTKLDVPISHLTGPPMPFPFNFGGPGLIPPPLGNPLFQSLPFPPMNLPHFGQKPPYIPPLNPNINIPVLPPTPNILTPPPPPPPPAPSVQVSSTTSPTSYKQEDINKLIEKQSPNIPETIISPSVKLDKKNKDHKKEKKDKIKKRNKKDKIKNKAEKKKLKEEKKEKLRKEKKEKRKDKEIKDDDSHNFKITLKLKSPSPRPETPETRKLNIKPIIKKDDDNRNYDEKKRESSPGLAKISALVCGPPKPKTVQTSSMPSAYESFPSSSSDNFVNQTKKTMSKPIPKLRTKEIRREIEVPLHTAPPSKYIDAAGNEVWICPACGRQDDGSPMIGCDDCDAWYHWVCVGIQVPPDDNEDWYCRHCLLKKNEDLQSDKQKKKRKKREKKEH